MTLSAEKLEQLAAMPGAARLKALRSLPSADARAYLAMTNPKATATAKAFAAGMGPALREWLAAALDPLLARIAALEARPVIKFVGVFRDDGDYRRGDMAVHAGALWHCNTDHTRGQPGKTNDWTLCVKKGAAG